MTSAKPTFRRALIAIMGCDVASRFDQATEVLVAQAPDGRHWSTRTMVLPHASAEDLCHLILTEKVDTVVCGGIEEEYHQYLTWKKISVIDSVMGPWDRALERLRDRMLNPGDVLHDRAGAES